MHVPCFISLTIVIKLFNPYFPTGKVYGQIEVQHKRYACPPDFIHLGHRCYYFSSEMATWHSAHFMCKDLGSQLAELETRWEDNNIRSYLNRPEFASAIESDSLFLFLLSKISFPAVPNASASPATEPRLNLATA
ncbi:C-type lectin domain family 2 member D5 [Portunus trituberculatus]|uniref:C-type lectin domain family 2 member D5 n=1 Tax=Portunus trituberculatus TaxID=210409 RepID=A0A5B7G3R9_PORTR|nr:C-type lectin domain family 2 member D5 [Portunus trituberculatus]